VFFSSPVIWLAASRGYRGKSWFYDPSEPDPVMPQRIPLKFVLITFQ
jgi:hypothetical protein